MDAILVMRAERGFEGVKEKEKDGVCKKQIMMITF